MIERGDNTHIWLTGVAVALPIILAILGNDNQILFCGLPIALVVVALVIKIYHDTREFVQPFHAAMSEIVRTSRQEQVLQRIIETKSTELAELIIHNGLQNDPMISQKLFRQYRGLYTDQQRDVVMEIINRAIVKVRQQ